MKSKRKVMKSFACVLGVLCMFFLEIGSVGAAELPVTVSLDELGDISQYDTNGDGLVYATIRIDSAATTLSSTQNGEVVANGVRLRVLPSSSSTVLELMYDGEAVCISYSVSSGYSGWYYLERLKTGTWGWASSAYISAWD